MKSTINRAAVEAFANQPSHDEIADRAYDLYMMRPVASGNDVEDWLRAERELMQERGVRRVSAVRRGARRIVEHDLAGK
jgi:hypothetical protein